MYISLFFLQIINITYTFKYHVVCSVWINLELKKKKKWLCF